MANGFLLVVLGVILLLSGLRAWHDANRDNYALFGTVLLLFVLVYSVTLLNLRVTGNGLTFEQAENVKKEIYAAKEDVEKIAESTLKTAFVLADGSSRFGGMPAEHKAQIEQYFKQVGKDAGLDYEKAKSDANHDIHQLQIKLDQRIKKESTK
jgi:hypothetical protein